MCVTGSDNEVLPLLMWFTCQLSCLIVFWSCGPMSTQVCHT